MALNATVRAVSRGLSRALAASANSVASADSSDSAPLALQVAAHSLASVSSSCQAMVSCLGLGLALAQDAAAVVLGPHLALAAHHHSRSGRLGRLVLQLGAIALPGCVAGVGLADVLGVLLRLGRWLLAGLGLGDLNRPGLPERLVLRAHPLRCWRGAWPSLPHGRC